MPMSIFLRVGFDRVLPQQEIETSSASTQKPHKKMCGDFVTAYPTQAPSFAFGRCTFGRGSKISKKCVCRRRGLGKAVRFLRRLDAGRKQTYFPRIARKNVELTFVAQNAAAKLSKPG